MPAVPPARVQRHALTIGALITVGSALAGGTAEVVAPHAYLADVPLGAELALVGLFFATDAFLVGLLLPGQDRTGLGRVRAWLDGLSVALAGFYLSWLLVFSTAGIRGAGMTAVLLGSLALAATVAAGLHATRDQARMHWYATGGGLCIAGLTTLVLSLDYHSMWVAGGAGGLAIVTGTAAIRHTARVPGSGATPPAGASPSGYPLMVLPLVAAAAATGYRLLQEHTLDRVTILLAIAGLVVVGAREIVNALGLRRYAAHLHAQGEHLRTMVLGTDDVALILDERLVVRWQSPTAARQFGLSDQEVVGRPVLGLLHPDDADRFAGYLAELTLDPDYRAAPCEVRLRDGYGAWRETECGLTGPDPTRPSRSWVVHIRDVSQRKELERALHVAEYTDRLTTLVNRRGLGRAGVPESGALDCGALDCGALVVIELAGLTGTVDRHGPDVGDTVLVEAARRLRTGAGAADTPARLDGTRFAVLTRSGAIQAHLLASRLLTALVAPYHVPGAVAHLTGRAGLADLDPRLGLDEAVRRAELAVRAGEMGTVEWYEPEVEARLTRRSALEQELPGALARGELDLVYQPIVELSSGRPVGAEALLRWRHPELGAVPPTELVPVAEELGLLDEIGTWLLHRVCRQLSTLRREHPNLWIAVNASTGQLGSAPFMAALTTALEIHQVSADALVVEVAEPGLVAARDEPTGRSAFTDLVAHLGQLRALGMRTAMDNFGTGPTSLSQLRLLPMDLLKIDRSVFGPVSPPTTRAAAIVDVMVKLGTQLGMRVIAQQLETEADLDAARTAGCHYAQGHLISAPLPAEHLEAYLDQHRHKSSP